MNTVRRGWGVTVTYTHASSVTVPTSPDEGHDLQALSIEQEPVVGNPRDLTSFALRCVLRVTTR